MSKKKKDKQQTTIKLTGIILDNGNSVHISDDFIDDCLAVRFWHEKNKLETKLLISRDAIMALTQLLLSKHLI